MSSPSAQSSSVALHSAKHTLSVTGHKVDNVMNVLKQNKYVFATILVLLLMYAPYAAPKLNKSLEGLLRNYFVKFVYIFVLTYLLTNSVGVAVVVSLVITIGALVLGKLESENFANCAAKKSNKLMHDVETHVIDVLPPKTLKCSESNCADAKSINVPSCPMQLEEQQQLTNYICNEPLILEPVENKPSFNGYVQAANRQVDENMKISLTPSAANEVEHDHLSPYTTDKKGDQFEPL